MRYLRTLTARTLAGTTCLLRIDLNTERKSDAFRIETMIPTIRFLLSRRARVVLMSHRGRPKRFSKRESLVSFIPFLRKRIGQAPIFLPRLDAPFIRAAIARRRTPLFLLENLRFHPGEERNDPAFARALASVGSLYVNEAFSVSHRKNASVASLPKYLPAYAGLRLEEEIRTLSAVRDHARRPLMLVVGGTKISDKIGLLKRFVRRADRILVGGATANTFLKARGDDIGNSFFEPGMLALARRLLATHRLILPVDFIADNGHFFDIGPFTAAHFIREIRRARTIIWNGPMGIFEKRRFRGGSETIARGIARSRAFSVVGGGETTELITTLGLTRRFDFLSTGGGAMLAFLGGEKLPGLEALQRSR